MNKRKRNQHQTFLIFSVICAVSLFFGTFFFWRDMYTEMQQLYYQLTDRSPQHTLSRIDVFTMQAASLNNDEREVRVYIPKSYDQNSIKQFPVLYLLHGDPGNNEDWLINADFQDTLDALIANNEVQPMLVVFPDGRGVATQDSQYVNATKVDQRMEDFIAQDVVHEIDSRYRTIPSRTSRALGGASSGGYAALNIGIHHNDVFGVLASFSGYFINTEWVTKTLFENDIKSLQHNNPLTTIDQYKLQPSTYIFMQIGDTDYPTFITQNKQMEADVKQRGC